jgi:hypothetical protein
LSLPSDRRSQQSNRADQPSPFLVTRLAGLDVARDAFAHKHIEVSVAPVGDRGEFRASAGAPDATRNKQRAERPLDGLAQPVNQGVGAFLVPAPPRTGRGYR